MGTLKEYRNPVAAEEISKEISEILGDKSFNIMEVCGGQTHTIYKYRLKDLLPNTLRLISGPGCPVCVTPIEYVDKAIFIAQKENVTTFTFSDLMKVPGSKTSLEKIKAEGADIRTIYSPFDALTYARENPDREVVFLGIGFETTIPTFTLPLQKAVDEGLKNFSVLLSAKRVPPVLRALLQSDNVNVHGFVTPGHATAIIGNKEYDSLCEDFNVPMTVGGFEPIDLLLAIKDLVDKLVKEDTTNGNAYKRVTRYEGNKKACELIDKFYEPADDTLRGFGVIPEAGFKFRDEYSFYDANVRFNPQVTSKEHPACRCGEVLAGVIEPKECSLFKVKCTPDSPFGACMVSSEGSCSAAYLYEEF